MVVKGIIYDEGFHKEYKRLSATLQKKFKKAVSLFQKNAFHPSLRLHKLSGKLDGLWSISISKRYRAIFQTLPDGKVLMISVGTHAIYD